MKFDCYKFFHFLKAEIYQINQIQRPQKLQKTVVLELLESP